MQFIVALLFVTLKKNGQNQVRTMQFIVALLFVTLKKNGRKKGAVSLRTPPLPPSWIEDPVSCAIYVPSWSTMRRYHCGRGRRCCSCLGHCSITWKKKGK